MWLFAPHTLALQCCGQWRCTHKRCSLHACSLSLSLSHTHTHAQTFYSPLQLCLSLSPSFPLSLSLPLYFCLALSSTHIQSSKLAAASLSRSLAVLPFSLSYTQKRLIFKIGSDISELCYASLPHTLSISVSFLPTQSSSSK